MRVLGRCRFARLSSASRSCGSIAAATHALVISLLHDEEAVYVPPSYRSAQTCVAVSAWATASLVNADKAPTGPAHATFQHVAHAEFAPYLAHVDRASPCR